jgi:drug/metabolite transporter (DMT)-like permease
VTARSERPTAKILLAFGVIYFVWGSTYLAIRVGVLEVPPLLFAAMRFVVAGAVLYAWMAARGEHGPRGREWISATLLGALIFLGDYGLVFWAEQRVPSGVAAVMMATIPAFIAIAEIVVLRTQRMSWRLAFALIIGFAGVAALMSRSFKIGGAPIDRAGAIALICGAMLWSLATVLTRKLPLPASKPMSSASQMLVGGILLTLAAALRGEFRDFHPETVSVGAWVALAYLIVAGSIVGFTAYVWLLHHESPTKVGTYAYVNPVVAVLIGYAFGGEALGLRTVMGTACVLASVVLITRGKKPAPEKAAKNGN